MEIGDWSETTSTLFNAGGSPSWPTLELQAEVNREVLSSKQLKINFFDQNSLNKDVALGIGAASLRSLCERLGQLVTLRVPIADLSGAVAGEAEVKAMLTKGDPSQSSEGLPESAVVVEKAMMRIVKIAAFDLGGGDNGLLDSKPDPYVTVQIGNSSELISRTSVLTNGGRCPNWEPPDMIFPVYSDILKFQRLSMTVMDKNNITKDSFMGRGDMSLRKIGSDSSGKAMTCTVRLKDMRGRSSGRIEMTVVLDPLPDGGDQTAFKEDFSQILGQLQLMECEVEKVRNTAVMGKQDLFVRFAVPTWTKQTPINKGAGKQAKWNLKLDTNRMVAAHLQRHGLKVQVVGVSVAGEAVVGEAMLPLQTLLDLPDQWNDLRQMLTCDGKLTDGKIRVKARFTTDQAQLEEWAKEAPPIESNGQLGAVVASQEQLQKQMSKLEAGLRAQIMKEMAIERKLMEETMQQQNKELKNALDKLARSMTTSNKEEPAKDVQDVQVELPKNISRWRTAHVQAWLGFEMELPDHLEAFAKASIDGLMLLHHVDDNVLRNHLDVTSEPHVSKLQTGIELLRMRQKRYDEHVEKKRLRKLEAEEALRRRADAAVLPPKEKKQPKKVKPSPKTFFGEVRESNIIDHARIERDMKEYRGQQKAKKVRADGRSKTWHFEYTGQPKPSVETIWDDKVDARIGSESYQKAMTADIAKELAPIPTKVRVIPVNCSTDEVLAIVKGAMFEMSTWLLEVEQLNYQRQNQLDYDLLAMDMPTDELQEHDEHDMTVQDAIEEPLEDPPSYAEFITEEGNEADPLLPSYDEFIADDHPLELLGTTAPTLRRTLPAHLTQRSTAAFLAAQQPITDRMTLIFRALVRQQNNDARWLGGNSKLTRLKLYGGMESLLRLQIEWSQFDAMWTKLDYLHSGDIDLVEFKKYFGDLSEFERLEGTRSLTLSAHSASISALVKALYELCDALRHANFTVTEMFSGFDRNGSGEVSISEFCSMLRLVLGNSFDKKLIYQALGVLDMDGNKAISLEEMLAFVYRIWRTQLDDLADKIYKLNEKEDGMQTKKLLDERQFIKQAIKKNFPRQWRDQLERDGRSIPGPFQNLLKKMSVNNEKLPSTATVETVSSPKRPTSAAPIAVTVSPHRAGRTLLAGKSTMLRFKVRLPPGAETDRYRKQHTVSPPKRNLHNEITMSGEAAQAALAALDPLQGFH